MKNALSLLAAATVMAVSAPASAGTVVAGIDFGTLASGVHLETATLAETVVNAGSPFVRGYGLVTTVNGSTSYCAGGGNNCALYYVYENYNVNGFGGTGVFQFTGGQVQIYYSASAALNLLSQDSNANLAAIQGTMTPWLALTGHAGYDSTFGLTGTLVGVQSQTGNLISEAGSGLLDVSYGTGSNAAVAAFMDGNAMNDDCSNVASIVGVGACAAKVDGFADIQLTSSASNFTLNPFDVANGLATNCTNVALASGWCLQGTMNARGQADVVPEPASLALVGLGLFGAGIARRRNRK